MAKKDVKNIRNSNIELLRIISMLLIIIHHFGVHGMDVSQIQPFTYNIIFIEFLNICGKIGVNLFIIISVFYSIGKDFKFSKLTKLIGQVLFYSIGLWLVFITVLEPVDTTIGTISTLKSFLPILCTRYWFVTDYVLLMFLSPFLNIIINKFERKDYKNLVVTLFIMSTIINGFYGEFLEDFSSNLLWFVTLYLIVGYIKTYLDFNKISAKKNIFIACITTLIFIALESLIVYLGHINDNNILIFNYAGSLGKQNAIFALLISLELFLGFYKIPSKSNLFINKVASTTLGIYLLHDNRYLRGYLWEIVFKNVTYTYSIYLIPYAIFTTLIIFLCGSIIDLIRQYTFEKIWLFIINKFSIVFDKIKNMIISFYKKIEQINIL